jgi:hypothetical protein
MVLKNTMLRSKCRVVREELERSWKIESSGRDGKQPAPETFASRVP